MDYWISNIWLFVLCLWAAFLVFSPDRLSSKISAAWLLSYYFAAPLIDFVMPDSDNQLLVQTVCGLFGAAASYVAFWCARYALSKIFALAAICHFIYFVILCAGLSVDALFFITFYSIEVFVVLFSLGVASHADRINGAVGRCLGGGLYDDRGDNR